MAYTPPDPAVAQWKKDIAAKPTTSTATPGKAPPAPTNSTGGGGGTMVYLPGSSTPTFIPAPVAGGKPGVPVTRIDTTSPGNGKKVIYEGADPADPGYAGAVEAGNFSPNQEGVPPGYVRMANGDIIKNTSEAINAYGFDKAGGGVPHDELGRPIVAQSNWDMGEAYAPIQKQLGDYEEYLKGLKAPTIDPTGASAVTKATSRQVSENYGVSSNNIAANRAVASRDIAANRQVTAQNAAAQQATAAQAGRADQAARTAINRTEDSQIRARQLGLLDRLDTAAQGGGPSVATDVGRSVTNTGLRQALAAQASAGGNAALAGSRAAAISANAAGRAGYEARMQKFNEQVQARQELAAAQSGVRAQDIGVNTNQANLDQSNQQYNTGARNQRTEFNTAADNQIRGLNAQLGTQVAVSNADRNLTAATTTQNLQQQADMDNAARALTASTTTQNLQQQADMDNAARALAAKTTTENLRIQAAMDNARRSDVTSQFNAGAQTQAQADAAARDAARKQHEADLQAEIERLRAAGIKAVIDSQTGLIKEIGDEKQEGNLADITRQQNL